MLVEVQLRQSELAGPEHVPQAASQGWQTLLPSAYLPAGVQEARHEPGALKKGDAEADEGSDKARELWVIRFSNGHSGQLLSSAFSLMDQEDILDRACAGAHYREDHAPKGSLQKALEGLIQNSKI